MIRQRHCRPGRQEPRSEGKARQMKVTTGDEEEGVNDRSLDKEEEESSSMARGGRKKRERLSEPDSWPAIELPLGR